MAVLRKDELIKKVKEYMGERITDDSSISLLEDLDDSYNYDSVEVSEKDNKIKELEDKIISIDTEWRKKYTDRFSGVANVDGVVMPPEDTPNDDPETSYAFESLFKEEG